MKVDWLNQSRPSAKRGENAAFHNSAAPSPTLFHRCTDAAKAYVGEAAAAFIPFLALRVERKVHVQRAGEDVAARHETPITTVQTVVATVAHHEVAAWRHGRRLFDGVLHFLRSDVKL